MAKQFDAASPSATQPIPAASVECIRTDQQTADGKVIFKCTVDWDEQMYAGATIVAESSLSHTIQFTVPAEGAAIRLNLQMPSTIDVDKFTLTSMKIASGPKPAVAAPAAPAAAPAGGTEAAASVASASAASAANNGAGASSAEAADSAAAPATEAAAAAPAAAPAPASRPKPLPIPIPGTFVANPKATSSKSAANSVVFVVDIPWDDEHMYHKAKLAIYVPPIAKIITTTLPQQPSNGKPLSVTLTLPKAVGTEPFALGQVSITSGPKPAPRVPQPVIMPPAAPPPLQQQPVQSMPLQMSNLPIAPVQLQSAVQASLASANAAANAAAAVRPRPTVVAMPVAPQAAPAPAPKPAATKVKPVPKRKAAATAAAPAAAPPPARVRRNPPPVAAPPAPAQQQQSRSGRSVKPAPKFGDKGEMDGAASSFKSSPMPRREMPPVSVETSVPAWAMPGGGEIYAYGLHAGSRKLFRAKVLRLRTQYPRIVVEYLSTEDGSGTSALELPEMRTAYLTINDIEEISP